MRRPTDTCLLCQAAPADKRNSHILPRFISTDFLKETGRPQRGYELGSDLVLGGKTLVVQDSPKEDYILCAACEHFLGLLEGLTADVFKKWRERARTGEYSEQYIIAPHLSVVTCTTADPALCRLLVYSMFWRASISSHKVFEHYKLAPAMEESLRAALFAVKSDKRADLVAAAGMVTLPLYPYTVLTAHNFKDGTANVVGGLRWDNPASLNVDRFGFLLFDKRASIQPDIFEPFTNIEKKDVRFIIMGEDLWYDIMVRMPLGRLIEQGRKSSGK